MARISLLFSLAFVLALGSLFLSVSGHASPVPSRKPACPKTVYELQTLPFTQITEILNRKERSAPKTAEFKAMFTMCKDYVAYLESLYKFENPIVDVLGIAKARYALMSKAILVAQASVSGKFNKKTSLKLKKSYADLTKGFLQIKETIVKISAKHQFNADAKITAHESKKINHAMINFKNSINAFINVVSNLEKNKMKKIGHHARTLKEDEDEDRVRSAFQKFFKKFGGYLGGKTHGRELAEAEYNANSHVGADVKGFESIYEKFSHFFGGYLGGHTHGRELFTVVPAGGKFSQYFGSFLGGKSHGRELFTVGPGGGNFSRYFGSFLGGKSHGRDLFTVGQAGGKFSQYFGSLLGGKPHGRELYIVGPAVEAPAGVNAAAPSGEIDKDVSQSDFDRFFESFFGDKMRSKAHRRELYLVDPAAEGPGGVNAAAPTSEIHTEVSQSTFDKFFESFFGDKMRKKAHRRELYLVGPGAEGPAGVDAAAPTSGIDKEVSQSTFDKFFEYYFSEKVRGKAHRRGLFTKAPAGGKFKGSFEDFFGVGYGEKVQYDAAGKMKVAGDDGFRSLNRAHYKHFASTEA